METTHSEASNSRDGMIFPEPVLNTLAGKRIALVGFEPTDAKVIVASLDEIDAFSRTIHTAQLKTRPSLLDLFDICICEVSHLPMDDGPRIPCDSVGKPVLLVGTTVEEIAQTLNHQPGRRDFLVKPWHPHDLVLRCFKLLRESEAATSADARAEEPTVVVADDDGTTTTLIAALLRNHQVKTLIAHDGRETIEAARNDRVQLVVLDVNMPKISGFEVLKTLKQDEATRPIKVAMLTSRQQETDIVRAFGLGADDYVVKPFNPLELVARVKRLLRN